MINDNEKQVDRGIIYVAFGYQYIIQAFHSIKTLRKFNKRLPVTLVTNCKIEADLENGISLKIVDAPNSENRIFKTGVYKLSPYLKTLFVDCDTEFHQDPEVGFDFLDHNHIAIRPEPPPYSMSVTETNKPEAGFLMTLYGEFNSGVIFFKKDPVTQSLFESWNAETLKHPARDQKHFLRALNRTKSINIWPLGAAWNYTAYDLLFHPKRRQLRGKPYVLHYSKYFLCRTALIGVREEAKQLNLYSHVSGLAFWKSYVIRPWLAIRFPYVLKIISVFK